MSVSDILTNISESTIIEALEENSIASLLYANHHEPTALVHNSLELISVLGTASPNAVARTRLPHLAPRALDARVTEILAPFKALRHSLVWWIWPSSQPTEIESLLPAHGLTYRGEGPGMALNLTAPLPTFPTPAGLCIETVSNQESLRTWLHTANVAYSGTVQPIEPETLAFEARLGWEHPYRRYLGWLDGAPAATSALFLGAGVAGISCVNTIPQARQRGLGTALTAAALLDAQAMGYQAAVLLSSPLGYPVYTHLGFHQCCRVRSYLWTPEEEQ